MRSLTITFALACALALAVSGCDYGVADGEDPSLLDESWGTEEYGLRVDDEGAEGVEGVDADRYEQGVLPATGVVLPVGYVQGPSPASSSGLPVQHPDPKPWKK